MCGNLTLSLVDEFDESVKSAIRSAMEEGLGWEGVTDHVATVMSDNELFQKCCGVHKNLLSQRAAHFIVQYFPEARAKAE